MKRKIMPDGYFVIFILTSVLFHFTFPIAKLTAYPYSLLGLAVIAIGFYIVFATNSLLLKKRTSVQPLEFPSKLITSGPFKFSRNPIYLGMTIVLFGVAITCGSLSPFIFPIIFLILINRTFIPIEENNLEKLFGQEYLDYKIKVRRWI